VVARGIAAVRTGRSVAARGAAGAGVTARRTAAVPCPEEGEGFTRAR
jgi:hypothetical protein